MQGRGCWAAGSSADMAESAPDVTMEEAQAAGGFETRIGDVGPNCLLVIFG